MFNEAPAQNNNGYWVSNKWHFIIIIIIIIIIISVVVVIIIIIIIIMPHRFNLSYGILPSGSVIQAPI